MVDWETIEEGKSKEYNRKKLENAKAMRAYKEAQFNEKQTTVDEYTGKKVHKKKKNTERKYHSKTNEYLANTDHIKPLKEGYEETKYNYFVTDEQLRDALNKASNFAITNGNINQSKKEKSNREYVLTNDKLDDKTKSQMLKKERDANKEFRKDIGVASLKNAGNIAANGAVQSGKYTAMHSSLDNLNDVIQGDKEFGEALSDTVCDTLKSGIDGACADVMQVAAKGGKEKVLDMINNPETRDKFQKLLKNENLGLIVAISANVSTLTFKLFNGDISMEEYRDQLLETGINMALFYQIALLTAPYGLVVSVVVNFLATKVMESIKQIFEEDKERQIRIENYRAIASQAEKEGKQIEKILHSAKKKYEEETLIALQYMEEARLSGNESIYGKGLLRLCNCYGVDFAVKSKEDMGKLLRSNTGQLMLGEKVGVCL